MLPADTARLRFRHILPNDLPQIFRLQSDPVTMAYIRPPETTIEAVVERLQLWADYQTGNPDYGSWIVEWQDGKFAGYCVLREEDWISGKDLEIGYTIAPEYWGKGLATEIAQALCHYAFTQFSPPKLVAFIDPANLASRRVLDKCGFVPVGFQQIYGSESLRLELLPLHFVYK